MSVSLRPTLAVVVTVAALLAGSGCQSYPFGTGAYPEVLSTLPATAVPVQPQLPVGHPVAGPQAASGGIIVPQPIISPAAKFPAPRVPTELPVPPHPSTDPTADPTGDLTGDPKLTIPTEITQPPEKTSALRLPLPIVGPIKFSESAATSSPAGAARDIVIPPRTGVATEFPLKSPIEEPAGFPLPKTIHPLSATTAQPEITETNFGYDALNFKWLKGTVEYDQADGTWHIMYSPTPTDRFGGDLSFVDDPRLKMLLDNDTIYVTGGFDAKLVDKIGKPLFKIETLNKIRK